MKHLSKFLSPSLTIALLWLCVTFIACHKEIDSDYSVSMACDFTIPKSSAGITDSLEIGIPNVEVINSCQKEGFRTNQITAADVKAIHISIDPQSAITAIPFSDLAIYMADENGNNLKKLGQCNGISTNQTELDIFPTLANITELIRLDKVKVVLAGRTNQTFSKDFTLHASLNIDFTAVIYN